MRSHTLRRQQALLLPRSFCKQAAHLLQSSLLQLWQSWHLFLHSSIRVRVESLSSSPSDWSSPKEENSVSGYRPRDVRIDFSSNLLRGNACCANSMPLNLCPSGAINTNPMSLDFSSPAVNRNRQSSGKPAHVCAFLSSSIVSHIYVAQKTKILVNEQLG